MIAYDLGEVQSPSLGRVLFERQCLAWITSFTVPVNLRMARFPIHEKFHRKLWQDVQARRAFELFGVSRERSHS